MVEDSVPTLGTEIVDALNSKLDIENVEPVISVSFEVKSEAVVSPPTCEMHNHNAITFPKLEVPMAEDGQENTEEEPHSIFNGVKTEVISSSEQQVTPPEDSTTAADGALSPDNASLPAVSISAEGEYMDENSTANGGQSVDNEEEGGMALGDGMSGPVSVPGESSLKHEAVMSGSNESESVNLIRIHHSPGSTH